MFVVYLLKQTVMKTLASRLLHFSSFVPRNIHDILLRGPDKEFPKRANQFISIFFLELSLLTLTVFIVKPAINMYILPFHSGEIAGYFLAIIFGSINALLFLTYLFYCYGLKKSIPNIYYLPFLSFLTIPLVLAVFQSFWSNNTGEKPTLKEYFEDE